MFCDLCRRILAWIKNHRDRSVILLGMVLLFLAGMAIFFVDFQTSTHRVDGEISRNDYGKGQKKQRFVVRDQDEKLGDLDVEVSEKIYTSSEMEKVFARVIDQMDSFILGDNQSLDHIDADMKLITRVPEQPIDISWRLDRYDVMNIYGELNDAKLTEEGTSLKLQATLTYRENTEIQALYECMAMIYPRRTEEAEGVLETLGMKIGKLDEETRMEDTLVLPVQMGERQIAYYYPLDLRGIVIMLAAVLIVILLFALDKQKEGERRQQKKQQMIRDYPEIISKLTLLLGAGMNVKRAWRKIVEDYQSREKKNQERYVYEEMIYTCHEMDGGISEAEGYERFGRRCNSQEYLRLGTLLSQNLRKGTKGLSELLNMEAVQAFEERKARARKAGEEAGTKLLGPMFLMLAEVLIVVVVPAFFSVKI